LYCSEPSALVAALCHNFHSSASVNGESTTDDNYIIAGIHTFESSKYQNTLFLCTYFLGVPLPLDPKQLLYLHNMMTSNRVGQAGDDFALFSFKSHKKFVILVHFLFFFFKIHPK
jgi:hypothetical protein